MGKQELALQTHFQEHVTSVTWDCAVFIYYVDFYPLGYNVMQSTESEPVFWGNMLVASSGPKSKPSK
jgi:hypothetical protein